MAEENSTEENDDALHEGAESKGKGKSPSAPVARAIARALWLPEFKAAQTDATNADVNAAWKAVRQEKSKPVLHALKALEKRGYTFTAPAGEEAEDGQSAGAAS